MNFGLKQAEPHRIHEITPEINSIIWLKCEVLKSQSWQMEYDVSSCKKSRHLASEMWLITYPHDPIANRFVGSQWVVATHWSPCWYSPGPASQRKNEKNFKKGHHSQTLSPRRPGRQAPLWITMAPATVEVPSHEEVSARPRLSSPGELRFAPETPRTSDERGKKSLSFNWQQGSTKKKTSNL